MIGGDTMIFDYKEILQLDDESYEAWTAHLEMLEKQALTQAELINPNVEKDVLNNTLGSYCQEFVFMAEYGSDLSASMYKWHTSNIATLEEAIRYAG